ncbi:MAG: starch-binding protein [Paludibacteraceae bacterium]|nr:starch-binding protein [Paludibacteraceae bacterium]
MKKLFLCTFALLAALVLQAATYYPSRTDFRDEQIYFLLPTRFYDGDPSNNTQCWDNQSKNAGDPAWRGDFKGLIEKMDYIKALGFTAIWITPIVENASGYDYHGYHAHDFSKVDHRHESEGVSFQTVIDEAHKRGMKIILDIVLNHTGNFGEANLCKLFERDWAADQSSPDECMIPVTQSEGGRLPDNYASLAGSQQYSARLSQMKNTTGVNYDTHNYWHHYGNFNWDEPNRWFAQIAGDCVDLNTENPAVYNYLIQCYITFINMGVDGFRIDTGGHIPRLSFNNAFIPAFIAAGEAAKDKRGETPFYMFAEVCARYSSILYREHANLSPFYYTWAESKSYAWDDDPTSWDNLVEMEGSPCTSHTNWQSCWKQADDDFGGLSGQPTSTNALLSGNDYHTPDYSQASGLHVIDFTEHWNFASASGAWNIAKPSNDKYYNDATWNVVYVDSHDYAPDEVQFNRFSKPQSTWAENLSLMYTHRGIPCVFYGSEVEFQKGKRIDEGTNIALQNSGRAYYGGYIKGDITTTDFAEYTGATGNLATSLSHPLAQHMQRLSKIRMAVPALRKGQYSVDGCSGSFAFKRRYTDDTTDSYALICISGNGTFTGILNGTYTDCVTGDTKTVTDGKLSVSCSGKGNLRVYVLSTDKTPAPGKIGEDGKYIFTASAKNIPDPVWDGTEMELTDDPSNPGGGEVTEPVAPCLTDADERAVFFTKSSDFGNAINCYIWHTGTGSTVQVCGGWPGKKAIALGNGSYKFVVPADAKEIDDSWMIIWNDGSGTQTQDLKFRNQYLYTGANKGAIQPTELITAICEQNTAVEEVTAAAISVFVRDGEIVIIAPQQMQGQTIPVYTATGQLIRTVTLHTKANRISGLPCGLYLVGGKKITI